MTKIKSWDCYIAKKTWNVYIVVVVEEERVWIYFPFFWIRGSQWYLWIDKVLEDKVLEEKISMDWDFVDCSEIIQKLSKYDKN